MRIISVGTSNSMLRYGFTYPLQNDKRVTRIDKACMGTSVSLLSCVTTENIDFRNYDFCIIDFSVNEQLFHYWGLSLNRIEDHVESFCAQVWQAGCVPVLMILPRKETKKDSSPVRNTYLNLASRLKIPFFDAIDIVEGFDGYLGTSRDDLFRDGGHMMEWLAIGVGSKLLDGLSQIYKFRPSIVEPWICRTYAAIRLSSQSRHIRYLIKRENNLFSTECLHLKAGEEVRFCVPPGSDLVGICVNLGSSAGHLKIQIGEESDQAEIVDLRNGYRAAKQDFVLGTLPLPNPIHTDGGELRLIALPPSSPDIINLPDYACILREAPNFENEGFVEIHSLIIRNGHKVYNERPDPALHIDLGQIGSDSGILCSFDLFKASAVAYLR